MTNMVQDEIAQGHYKFMHRLAGIPESDPLPDDMIRMYQQIRLAHDRAQVGGLKPSDLVMVAAVCNAVRMPVATAAVPTKPSPEPAGAEPVRRGPGRPAKPEREYSLNRPVQVGIAEGP